MAQQYFDEYLVSLKPDVDMNAWRKASGSITGVLQKTLLKPFSKNLDNERAELERLQKLLKTPKQLKESGLSAEEVKKRVDELQKTIADDEAAFNAFSKNVTTASISLGVFIAAVKAAIDAAQAAAKQASEISNQFVSQGSIKVNRDVRNVMAKFGVDASTAQSITSASEILNYDLSEYAKWTQAQREAFSSLMKEYQTGIDKINPNKLQQFNKATQEYQLMQARFQLKFKLALTEMYANSEGLVKTLNTLGESMDSIAAILSSDVVKGGFDLLMGIINGILKFVTTPLNWLGSLFNGGGSNTTNNTANVNTTVNTTGGIDSEQLAIDIGLSVKNAMTGR